jgi:hypothetical protein
MACLILIITGQVAALEGFDSLGMNPYEQSVLAAFSYASSSKACGLKSNYEQLKYLYEGLISYGVTHGAATKATKAIGAINKDTLIEMGVKEYSRTSKISCQDVRKFAEQLIPTLTQYLLK